MKACASRQEKPSFCHRNGAAANPNVAYYRRLKMSHEIQIAWPAHLDTLAQVYPYARLHSSTLHQVTNGASCRRSCCRILAAIELHPRAPLRRIVPGRARVGWAQHIEPSRTAPAQPLRSFLLDHVEARQRLVRFQNHDCKWRSRGNNPRRQRRIRSEERRVGKECVP